MPVSLWGDSLPPEAPKAPAGNPCIQVYGPGPEGKRCKTCKHLFAGGMQVTYYKCGLRILTHGPGSDHRVRWAACGKYEEREKDGNE